MAGDYIAFFWKIHPWLACKLINGASYEYEVCKKFEIRDCLDLAIACHLSSYYHYYKNKDLFDIPIIYYEDLIADKEKILRSVFELCELPYEKFANIALDQFNYDSQDGTSVSQTNMKVVQDTPLGEEKIAKINRMCIELGIPNIYF
jgi:hypothetical protein